MMACPKNPFPPVSSRVRGDDGDDGGETAAPSEPGTISQSMPETSAKASWEHLVMLYLVEVKEKEQSRPEQGLFRVRHKFGGAIVFSTFCLFAVQYTGNKLNQK